MRMRGLGTRKGLFPVNLPTRLFLLACVVLTVGLAGCASISQLTVAPTTVCPGENVNVSWRTCGMTTLTQVHALIPVLQVRGGPAHDDYRYACTPEGRGRT